MDSYEPDVLTNASLFTEKAAENVADTTVDRTIEPPAAEPPPPPLRTASRPTDPSPSATFTEGLGNGLPTQPAVTPKSAPRPGGGLSM
jgi:hypothetical protein